MKRFLGRLRLQTFYVVEAALNPCANCPVSGQFAASFQRKEAKSTPLLQFHTPVILIPEPQMVNANPCSIHEKFALAASRRLSGCFYETKSCGPFAEF